MVATDSGSNLWCAGLNLFNYDLKQKEWAVINPPGSLAQSPGWALAYSWTCFRCRTANRQREGEKTINKQSEMYAWHMIWATEWDRATEHAVGISVQRFLLKTQCSKTISLWSPCRIRWRCQWFDVISTVVIKVAGWGGWMKCFHVRSGIKQRESCVSLMSPHKDRPETVGRVQVFHRRYKLTKTC